MKIESSFRRCALRPASVTGSRSLLAVILLAACALPAAAQTESEELAELRAALERERQARLALEQRLEQMEQQFGLALQNDAEHRLRGLVGSDPTAPARAPTSPSFYNPSIGVFMDSVVTAGNFDSKLGGEHKDGFSLRETEVDFRLPISPFAEGVGIFVWEDEGGGEFETSIEEGYANIALGGLFDNDWTGSAKVGRFRPMFGRNNALHTHDWLQVHQPLPVQHLLGEHGIVGDGVMLTQPLWHSNGEAGRGQATTLNLAVVNGDLLAGHHGPYGELAEDAGLELESDGEMIVARLAHFMELGGLDDLELGVSHMRSLSGGALSTDAGTEVEPDYIGADVTWRIRPDETGIGSWLLQAETIRSRVDYEASGVAGYPSGTQRRSGWWTTVQRQMTPTVYLGLLYARSELLGTQDEDRSVSPYVSWYADEFFRIRWQLDFLDRQVKGGSDIDAWRALMQFTWNFGAHQPHPYWVNR